MPRKKLRGVRAYRGKKEASVTVRIDGQKRQRTKLFALDTTDEAIQAWRTKVKGAHAPAAASPHGSLGAMRDDYLQSRQSAPTYDQIAFHLACWVRALGADRAATTVTEQELNVIMDTWARTPTNQPDPTQRGRRGRPSDPAGLTAASIKKRRGTLRRMFTVMLPRATNPVRLSVCPSVPTASDARGLDLADALRILAAMPVWVYPRKRMRQPCASRLRAAVLLWTGLPPELMKQVKAKHLALDAVPPVVHIARRLKAGGVEARVVTLSPQGAAAWRALRDAGLVTDDAADDDWSEGAFNVSVKRAARRAGVPLPPKFHAYDLRHTFGSALAESGAGEDTIGRLMLHAEHSTVARRYTQAAHRKVNAAAVAALGRMGEVAAARVGAGQPADPPAVPKAGQKAGHVRKSPKTQRLRLVI